MIIINKKFTYPKLERNTEKSGSRKYVCPNGIGLPSVTTILSKTGDKTGLIEWRKRVGDVEANRISTESTNLGTLVHDHLERHILGEERKKGKNLIHLMASKMADVVINRGLVNVTELWGLEEPLYYPGLFAGTADLIGVYKGVPTIMDFKSAKKIKKEEYLLDYYCQLVAYSLAHNELFGTNINMGVIFMVDRDYNYQEFILDGEKFVRHVDLWLERVEEYYKNNPRT